MESEIICINKYENWEAALIIALEFIVFIVYLERIL